MHLKVFVALLLHGCVSPPPKGSDDTAQSSDSDSGTGPCTDCDGDRYTAPEDCDDGDAAVNPGATEVCDNGIDDDCDGSGCRLAGEYGVSDAVARMAFPSGGGSYYDHGALAVVRDCSGDGLDDLLVGNRQDTSAGVQTGAAYLVAGPMSGELVPRATFLGEAEEDYLGQYVGGVGDLDGDGVRELLAGGANVGGDTESDFGGVYAVESDLTGTHSLGEARVFFDGSHAGESGIAAFASVLGVDLNIDGVDDVVIGDYGLDGSTAEDAGGVYVFGGPIDDGERSAESDYTTLLYGSDVEGRAGFAIAAAGDVAGDGTECILVGAYDGEDDAPESVGRASLVCDPPEGALELADTSLASWLGESEDDQAGWAVSSAGDVDGDGRPDLIVGERNAAGSQGAAFIVLADAVPSSGTYEGKLEDAAVRIDGTGSDYLGSAVSGGDLDGDGTSDVAVGGRKVGSYDTGGVLILYGPVTSGAYDATSVDAAVYGAASDDNFGYAVAIGDLTGEGHGDLAVLGSQEDGGGIGFLYVYQGLGL